MNYAYYRISLDVQDISAQVSLPVRRWDTGRGLMVTLTENGTPYEIKEGCSAEFVCVRPNGSVLKNPCEIDGNGILYHFTRLTTSLTGTMECEIRLTGVNGELLTSPRFILVVYATVYDYGDATESEVANANTVKSANPGYAEVFMWSDGNPDGENRIGYFVGSDTEHSAAMVRKASPGTDIRGVSMASPGFATNAPGGRYDDNGSLLPRYCYVGLMGFAPVIDNGRCAANDRCMPGEDGTAVKDDSGNGFLVVERIDDTHALILLDPAADMIVKVSNMVEKKLDGIRSLKFENVTIQKSAFLTDETYLDFPYRAAAELSGVVSSMVPEVVFPVADAVSGNYAPVAKCYDGGLYIYSASIPESAITIPTILCWR